jgi:type II secretory pathway predicted ATPase ExeA
MSENQEKVAAFQKLNKLVGMEGLKNEIRLLAVRAERAKMVKDANDPRNDNRHYIITGNPGTGKTTAARLLGEALHEAGYLERGHIVEVASHDLIAGYVGQTAAKTKEKIELAMGGVLFIDEAYSLGMNDFGTEAVHTILAAMSDKAGQFSVMLAGYPEQMETFTNSNPGFKRHFSHIHIDDYTPDEMVEILHNFADGFVLTPEYIQKSKQIFEHWVAHKDCNFGNARDVRKYFEGCKYTLDGRLFTEYPGGSDIPAEAKNTLTGRDVPSRYSPIAGDS